MRNRLLALKPRHGLLCLRGLLRAASRGRALLLILLAMTGCASSVARQGPPREAEGAQQERALAATALAPDTDKDTIPDSVDACPEEAEDVDAFQDTDGCPDLDHDRRRDPR